MWIRTATLTDLTYCLRADALAGVSVDRTKYLQSILHNSGPVKGTIDECCHSFATALAPELWTHT